MVREMITIDIGGADIYSSSTIWQQFNPEHNIDKDGERFAKDIYHTDAVFKIFYAEQYIRHIMVDTESNHKIRYHMTHHLSKFLKLVTQPLLHLLMDIMVLAKK